MSNRSQETKASLDDWLTSITSDWPIAAATQSPFENSLHQLLARYPSVAGTEVEAVLWLRLGLIDRAHEIVQNGKRGVEAYIHGVVHRLEGDYWNSKYWFRQVQDASLLKKIGEEIIDSLKDPLSDSPSWQIASKNKLIHSNQFQFEALVDICETLAKSTSKSDTTMSVVQQIVKSEWDALLGILR
jgi:hypothetical protein